MKIQAMFLKLTVSSMLLVQLTFLFSEKKNKNKNKTKPMEPLGCLPLRVSMSRV